MKRFLIFFLILFFHCHGKPKDNEFDAAVHDAEHHKKEVVAFVYHRFGEDKYPSTNIAATLFEKHLAYLKSHEFKVLTFGEAIDYLNNPEIDYYKKVACITVDDGYKSFKSGAVPLLQKYGYKASVFINSESVGGGSYMNWAELKEIHELGIEIGNHSHSHAYFVNKPKEIRGEEFKADVMKCQEEIKAQLGYFPDVFAYPYGEYDAEMSAVIKDMGFKGAAAQNSGVMYLCDNYALSRFPMAGDYAKLDGFIEKANMKALRVVCKDGESDILTGANPPTLTLSVDSCGADLSRLNCFTSGDCEINVDGNIITVRATEKLKERRTRYTITAPGKKGNSWYWYSKLWVRPEISE